MKRNLIVALLLAAFLNVGKANAQEPFIGEIRMFAGTFAPRGWAFCDGSIISIAQNSALFSLLGTTYGGNGQTTFALPDMRGRVPMHAGTGTGLSPRVLGERSGTENVTLTIQNLPAHSHPLVVSTALGTTNNPSGAYLANTGALDKEYGTTGNAILSSSTIGVSGGGQPIPIMQPYTGVNFIIALQGIYPSRP